MKTLTINYPDAWLAVMNSSTGEFEAAARMAMAVKLYELGRLTSGQAAGIADVNRVEFLLHCGEFGADSVKWDHDELVAEKESLI